MELLQIKIDVRKQVTHELILWYTKAGDFISSCVLVRKMCIVTSTEAC